MKHQVYTFLLLVSFSLCAESIVDKSYRIGRFGCEESFDQGLAESILKKSPSSVRKSINKLLYSTSDEDTWGQRLLLLGGVSIASTNAIAKAMALRCGYEYYVVEAAALLREYREGRQMILSEICPIIKEGKPIAIIITELPEMADYSGLLASTLWLLIDQCAQYQDVLVIATSGFHKEQLSEEVKDYFGGDIVPIVLERSTQEHIKKMIAQKISWIAKYKIASFVVAGFACCALAAVCVFTQILFAAVQVQKQKEDEKKIWEQKIIDLSDKMRLIVEESGEQNKLSQTQHCGMQKELLELKIETIALQQQAYQRLQAREEAESRCREEAREVEEKAKKAREDDEDNPMSLFYYYEDDEDDFGF